MEECHLALSKDTVFFTTEGNIQVCMFDSERMRLFGSDGIYLVNGDRASANCMERWKRWGKLMVSRDDLYARGATMQFLGKIGRPQIKRHIVSLNVRLCI